MKIIVLIVVCTLLSGCAPFLRVYGSNGERYRCHIEHIALTVCRPDQPSSENIKRLESEINNLKSALVAAP